MVEASRKPGGKALTLTRVTALLCFGSAAAALIAAVGSGQGLWHFRVAFQVVTYAMYAALIGGCLGFWALWLAARAKSKRLVWTNIAAIIVSGIFTFYVGSYYAQLQVTPSIHDASTNLDDLPQFSALTLRADNLENVPTDGRPELEALAPEARWKALHRAAYSDLRTVRVPWSMQETVQRAEALARERGWDVARVDPAGGALEATATSLFFRFKDDVVVRVRPAPEGGSLVDMRSVSRVGRSDFGVNAKRVREFLRDLRA